jgi:hypothetical protein
MNTETLLAQMSQEPNSTLGSIIQRPNLGIITENINVCNIGHAFGKNPGVFNNAHQQQYFLQDFIVDQSQSTGGGAAMADPTSFDLSSARAYQFWVANPCGKKFKITMPAGVTKIYFEMFMGRRQTHPVSGYLDASFFPNPFVNPVGAAPVITYHSFSITHGTNDGFEFKCQGYITADFTFDAINLLGDYATHTAPSGALWYAPYSTAVPIGAKPIYPKSETFILFGYTTSTATDPGRIITLI